MRSKKDLTGQRFGSLVAVCPTEERSHRQVVWECKCDCGNTAFVRTSSLTCGTKTSCGCLNKDKGKDITGQRFGSLVAVRPTEERSHRQVVWECKCDCGNITFVSCRDLNSGNIQSCGCSRINNFTGQRFGKLTVLRPTDERKNGSVVWECQCDCGNTTFVKSRNLVLGYTQSCGCLHMKDLTGQRFGRLTVLRPTEQRKYRQVVWECRCDCGNTVFVRGSSLSNGLTQSCGCLQMKDLTGQRFGKLTVLRPTEQRKYRQVVWECRCDCGNTVFIRGDSLSNGLTQSCGCLKRK